jgi:hypothetical protein
MIAIALPQLGDITDGTLHLQANSILANSKKPTGEIAGLFGHIW